MRISDWSSDVCSSDLAGENESIVAVNLDRLQYSADICSALGTRLRILNAHASGEREAVPLPRSEEHTSELQSLMRISYAVFCLKKKKKKKYEQSYEY